MKLSSGNPVGPYQILAPIGAGGMGEVYRALDPRLGREVAIKVLPEQYSTDTERLRRFEQEARAVGALNHPNILTVYDIGAHEGSPYVVSELLSGQTLRERMGGSPIGALKSVEYSLQIAHGLAAAHEKGIVHRDLKPENIFVTRDGRVKILDFGLAKLRTREPEEGMQSALPTIDPGTQPGVVMGTVGYMSPEQVRGRAVDHRSDIYSFGAILYEMLTGQRAFQKDSTADTMSAILHEEPPALSGSGKTFPPALERIIRHCLEKNAEERFQSARDLAFDLEMVSGVSGASVPEAVTAKVPSRRVWKFAVPIAIALISVLVGFLVGRSLSTGSRQTTEAPSFQRMTFRRGYVSAARFAPDRQTILYSASWGEDPPTIFSTRPQSPVSRSLGLPVCDLLSVSSSGEMAILLTPVFFSGWQRDGTLARVPIDGGAPREVLEHVQDADWAPNGKDLAVVRNLSSPPRTVLEYPIGKALYETRGWISNPRISPDGTMVAFLDHPGPGDDRGHVSVVDLRGHKKDLTGNWGSESGLAWGPESTEIWFTASEHGGNQQQLYGVSLQGKLRVISSMAGNLILHDLAPGGEVLVTQDSRRREMIVLPPGETEEKDLSWFDWSYPRDISDDGELVLFEEQGAGGGASYSVYLRSTDGSPAVRLGEGYAVSLSPDKKWALASLPGGFNNPITIFPTGAGQPRALSGDLRFVNFAVDWFRGGKRLMIAALDEQSRIRSWVYDMEREESRPLTPEGILGLAISREEKFIYARETATGKYLMFPLDGTEPVEISALHRDDTPLQITKDESSVYVAETGVLPVRVFLVHLKTGERKLWKEISPPDPAGINEITNVLITPDGKSYAYTYRRVLSDLYLGKGLQ